MVYNPERNFTLLYGGWNPTEGRVHDTWVFYSENLSWNQEYPEHIPSVSDSFSLYYDTTTQKIILFGGYVDVGDHSNQMWEFNAELNDWIKIKLSDGKVGWLPANTFEII